MLCTNHNKQLLIFRLSLGLDMVSINLADVSNNGMMLMG